jgi:hypothetical protein
MRECYRELKYGLKGENRRKDNGKCKKENERQ